MVSIETIEEEILNLEKRDTSYAVCERLAWLYTVRDHLKKPTVDATVMEQRITDELTGSEFLKAASNVDYAALMEYSTTICRVSKPSARRNTMQSCRRSTRYGSHYLSNSVKHLSHT